MQKMLHSVIEQGTGKPARLDGYTAGGKTATAQLVEHGQKSYGNRFVSSFVGITPAENAQFVILVTVTKPTGMHYGGQVAGPVFKEIAEKALLARRFPRDGVMRAKPHPVEKD
jgi:cell division protein FtsI/penicillin-binding protein 2